MSTGRKPKPTAIKVASGNPGRRRLNDAEPKLLNGRWYAPKTLNEDGQRLWRMIMKTLGPAGVITEGDLVALQLLCENFEDRLTARREYLRSGMIVEGSTGTLVVSPAVRIAKALSEEIRWYLAEFGLTPSSRSKIRVETNGDRSLAEILFSELGED